MRLAKSEAASAPGLLGKYQATNQFTGTSCKNCGIGKYQNAAGGMKLAQNNSHELSGAAYEKLGAEQQAAADAAAAEAAAAAAVIVQFSSRPMKGIPSHRSSFSQTPQTRFTIEESSRANKPGWSGVDYKG